MVLLVVAHIARFSQVTHASLARRKPNCHPHLRGLVSPQNVELPACTKGSIKQRTVQKAVGPVHKSLHTTCPKITHIVLIFAAWGSRGHSTDWTVTLEDRSSPSALMGAVASVGGCLASASKPHLRLQQGPASGMVLLLVAGVVFFSQVTHEGLAARDPTCHPPLRGLVSPQNVELSGCTKGSMKQRMVQNAFGPVHKSLHTTCPKITHRVLILAPWGSRSHSKHWTVTLENGPSPSALMGAIATIGGCLASASEHHLRLRQAHPSGMVLLVVADDVRFSQVTHAGLAARAATCHPPPRGLVSPQNVILSACTKASSKRRMVQKAFGAVHKCPHTTPRPPCKVPG